MIELPTSSWRPGDPGDLALFAGRLTRPRPGLLTGVPAGGDPTSPMGVLLVWPDGFTAEEGPDGVVRVLDPEGQAVLAVGETFTVAGGVGADGAFVMNGYPERSLGL